MTFCVLQNELCIASGPGKDMFDSTRIIGQNQFNKAIVRLITLICVEQYTPAKLCSISLKLDKKTLTRKQIVEKTAENFYRISPVLVILSGSKGR
jgi:hypothetical protein